MLWIHLHRFRKMVVMCAIMCILLLTGCSFQETSDPNTVKYEGKEYLPLEYPMDIFCYDYNGNSQDNFEEIEGIYPIESPQWEMIWNAGDLYCDKDAVEEANGYYASDDNYVWYVEITEDIEESCPIEVSDTELEFIYGIEEMEKDTSVFFDEFEALGSLFKISMDGVVQGIVSIVKYDGKWYWNSEIIDESRTRNDTWPQYIQPLPESLSNKITENE